MKKLLKLLLLALTVAFIAYPLFSSLLYVYTGSGDYETASRSLLSLVVALVLGTLLVLEANL